MPAKDRRHYAGGYKRRALGVRVYAYADPATRCWRCGLTLEQARSADGPGVRWQAGHVRDGEVGGDLLPEHSTCNARAGASYGNAKREPRSRYWT